MKEDIKQSFCWKFKTIVIFAIVICITACETTKAAEVSADVKPVTVTSEKKSEATIFAEKLQVALRSGSTEDALKLFETIPESIKDNTDMLILKASLLLSVGRIDEASEIANKLSIIDPNNTDVMELKLVIATALGDKEARALELKNMLETDPKNVEANLILADDALDKNDYKQAQKYYQTALSINKNNEDAMFGLGLSYYFLNKPQDAEKSFKEIVEKDDKNEMALLYLGKLAAEQARYRLALDYAQKAEKLNTESYDIYLDLGTYYRQLLKLPEAEKAWTKAIALEPDYFLAYAYRASLYDEMDELDKAYFDYKKVIETNPKYFYAFESLGMLAWYEKDYAASYESFKKALDLDPNNISYILMMAANLKRVGRDAEYKKFLELKMKPLDRASTEYAITRLFHDGVGVNAENSTLLKIKRESSSTRRGKFLYYMGLFYDLMGKPQLASSLYSEVVAMQRPLFFEYRLAGWSLDK